MKKIATVSKKLLTTSFIASSLIFAGAQAADNYFLEIGKPASVEEARLQWESLSEKYRALSKLKFFPKSVVSSGGITTHTIQAGPITEKNRAQKICNILFTNNIECFVIEGVNNAPPTMSMNMSQAFSSWQPPVANPQQETVSVEIGSAPALFESKDIPPPTSKAASLPAPTADVDVAEAIAVPLSNKNDDRMDLSSNIGKASGDTAVVSFSSWDPGYLIIESFASEAAANKFWGYIVTESPDTAHGMKVKVQRALLAKNTGGVQLRIGLFENGTKAADFCNSMVPGYDNRLKCIYDISTESFVKSEPTVKSQPLITQREINPEPTFEQEPNLRNEIEAEQKAMTEEENTSTNRVLSEQTLNSRGDVYESRRRLLQRRVPSEQSSLYHRSPSNQKELVAAIEKNKYWAQIVLADSREEANRRLEEIRSSNTDIVGDASSEILASASSHAKYSVRLGPYISEDDANTVCDNLQLRGVDCLMITTR